MIKINEIRSAYVISIYILLIGLFLLFYEVFGLKLDSSEVSIYIIKERGTYYIMSALIIFQLYMASSEFYYKLVNTLSLVFFIFMFMQPLRAGHRKRGESTVDPPLSSASQKALC